MSRAVRRWAKIACGGKLPVSFRGAHGKRETIIDDEQFRKDLVTELRRLCPRDVSLAKFSEVWC